MNMTTENNQCSNVKQFYTTPLKEVSLSESEMLLELAILQFNCFRDVSEHAKNSNTFRLDQQIILSRKIKSLLEKFESKFLEIDEYSTFAVFILMNELDRMVVDDRYALRADIAETLTYYLNQILEKYKSAQQEENIYLERFTLHLGIAGPGNRNPKNQIGDKNIELALDIHQMHALYEKARSAIKKMKSTTDPKQKEVILKDAIHYYGEVLYNNRAPVNGRVIKILTESEFGKNIAVLFQESRNLMVHGQFSAEIEIPEKMISVFENTLLPNLEKRLVVSTRENIDKLKQEDKKLQKEKQGFKESFCNTIEKSFEENNRIAGKDNNQIKDELKGNAKIIDEAVDEFRKFNLSQREFIIEAAIKELSSCKMKPELKDIYEKVVRSPTPRPTGIGHGGARRWYPTECNFNAKNIVKNVTWDTSKAAKIN